MERVIFVEVLGRRGELIRRERIVRLPFSIGRALSNDLILDDPHVDAEHLVVEAGDPIPVIRDRGSLNGLRTLPDLAGVAEVGIRGDLTIEIGRSRLRFRDATHEVPTALPLRRRPPWVSWALERPFAALLWLLLLLGVGAIDTVRSATTEIDWPSQATAWGTVLLLVVCWAGSWALIGRFLGQHPRFVAHLAIGVVGMLALDVRAAVYEIGQFLVPVIDPLRTADIVVGGLLVAAVTFAHLTVLRVGFTMRRAGIAVGVGLIPVAFGITTLHATPTNWVATLPYWSRLEPIDPAWLRVEEREVFFREVAALEHELEGLRAEALAEKAASGAMDDTP